MRRPASRNNLRRRDAVAKVEPLPGNESPSASVRQFIEFAVNIPEQDPHVGQAEDSTRPSSSSEIDSSADMDIASTRSVR